MFAITSGVKDSQLTLNMVWDMLLPAMNAAPLAADDAARKHYESVMAQFVATQAPRLAETLVVGAPCPVCGATEHPAPAQLADGETVDHDTVDEAREAWSQAHSAVAQMQTAIDELSRCAEPSIRWQMLSADSSNSPQTVQS